MVVNIVTATVYLLRSQAGEQFGSDEIDKAMALLAKPTDQLRYGPTQRLGYIKQQCDRVLMMSPEERCEIFLEGVCLGIQNRGGSAPHQSAYRILTLTLPTLPEEATNLWQKVLDAYRQQYQLHKT